MNLHAVDHAAPIGLSAAELDAGRQDWQPASPAQRPEVCHSEEPRWRDWAERAGQGDREAFSALVEASQDRLYRFLLRITRNAADAEDLAQDTFVKAFVALGRGPAPDSFLAWLFTIARRTALNHRRDQRPCEPLEEASTVTTSDDPAGSAGARDAGEQLWRLARRLPARQYEALWLRYGEGFSVAEVARITGATQISAKVILHRARRRLADWLTKENRAEDAAQNSKP